MGDLLKAVTPCKQSRVRLTAEQYLAWKGARFADNFDEMRFDVVSILLGATGVVKARHVEDASRRRVVVPWLRKACCFIIIRLPDAGGGFWRVSKWGHSRERVHGRKCLFAGYAASLYSG